MMLVMWYSEVRVSRSDLEALSYARSIQRCSFLSALPLDPPIRSGVQLGNSFRLQRNIFCNLGVWGMNIELAGNVHTGRALR